MFFRTRPLSFVLQEAHSVRCGSDHASRAFSCTRFVDLSGSRVIVPHPAALGNEVQPASAHNSVQSRCQGIVWLSHANVGVTCGQEWKQQNKLSPQHHHDLHCFRSWCFLLENGLRRRSGGYRRPCRSGGYCRRCQVVKLKRDSKESSVYRHCFLARGAVA